MSRPLAFLLALAALALLSPRASADFTSTFDIPVGNGTYTSDGPVGNWYLTTVFDGGAGTLSTYDAPTSISMNGYASGPGDTSSATLEFASFAQAGTVSVDFNFIASVTSASPTSSSASFTILVDGTPVDTYSSTMVSTAVVPVLAGDNFSFYVSGSGGISYPPFPVTVLSGTGAVILSNFTFTPVPEPAATAATFGLLAAFAVIFRARLRRPSPAATPIS